MVVNISTCHNYWHPCLLCNFPLQKKKQSTELMKLKNTEQGMTLVNLRDWCETMQSLK